MGLSIWSREFVSVEGFGRLLYLSLCVSLCLSVSLCRNMLFPWSRPHRMFFLLIESGAGLWCSHVLHTVAIIAWGYESVALPGRVGQDAIYREDHIKHVAP